MTLVQASISSRLDYWNSLLYGVAYYQLCRLQAIHNAAARVVIGMRNFDHVSQALCGLHWLPVRKRVVFKVAMLVFKCLHGLAPPYLTEFCIPVSSIACIPQHRSADPQQLYIPRSRAVIGHRAFSVCGPINLEQPTAYRARVREPNSTRRTLTSLDAASVFASILGRLLLINHASMTIIIWQFYFLQNFVCNVFLNFCTNGNRKC